MGGMGGMGGERLYLWIMGEMVKAGRTRDPKLLEPVLKVFHHLHEGWEEVVKRPQEGLKWAS